MKILLAASEVAPIIKLGGLGDVVGSLPKALEKIGVNADVIVPFFPGAKTENLKVYKSIDLNVPFNEETVVVELYKTKLPGSDVDVLMLKSDRYFSKGGANAYLNNDEETQMFSFFSKAVAEYIKTQFNTYDLVHCNDWHTGLVTHLLADELGNDRPATLFTIHNLMYQGIGGSVLTKEMGIIPGEHPLIDWDTSDGDINLVQQGVTSSDFVNTVSPTYAKEILTKEMGGGLDEILVARGARLSGILNGLDYSQFSRDFDSSNYKEIKPKIKKNVIEKLGLKGDDRPLISYIGRIDPYQKGISLIHDGMGRVIELGGNFALLATGDKEWEKKMTVLGDDSRLKENVSINLKFDVNLALEIYAASDYLLVPSKYEPCGLIQLIAMWYGALPIAHNVGGLRDTVIEGKTGYSFDEYSTEAMLSAVTRAFNEFGGQSYYGMVENALNQDYSWDKSAKEYANLYKKVVQIHKNSLF